MRPVILEEADGHPTEMNRNLNVRGAGSRRLQQNPGSPGGIKGTVHASQEGRKISERTGRGEHLAGKQTLLFVFAFCCGFVQVVLSQELPWGSGWESLQIARELARTGTYGNPFAAGPSGPTAVIAPLFPVYLATLIKVLGDRTAMIVAAVLGILVPALSAALLPRVSLIFFKDASPGVYAGLLSAFAFLFQPQWDAPFTACAVLLFFVISDVTTWRKSALSGVFAGLLLLTNPASALITGPWIVYLCVSRRASPEQMVALAAVASAVVVPWMLRNNSRFGAFSVKTNFGMTAYASNNDCAQPSIEATIRSGCYDAMHPNHSARELELLHRLGEGTYDHLRAADTVAWIRSHPGAFLRLTATRSINFWFPAEGAPKLCIAAIWLGTALSFPGFYLALRRQVSAAYYLISVAGLYPLLYYVVVSSVRYRYPLLWVSFLCSGYLLASLTGRFPSFVGPAYACIARKLTIGAATSIVTRRVLR